MNRLQRAAVMVSLVEALEAKGSWCGGTHVQKACYFLQSLLGTPLEYKFTLYKHGPYSFDLNDELSALRADEFLELYLREPQYGPSYRAGELAEKLGEGYAKTVGRFQNEIRFVTETLGEMNVAELERIATALFVRKNDSERLDKEIAGKLLHRYKPHIPIASAVEAIAEIDEIIEQAKVHYF